MRSLLACSGQEKRGMAGISCLATLRMCLSHFTEEPAYQNLETSLQSPPDLVREVCHKSKWPSSKKEIYEPLLPFVLVLGGDDNENGLREEIYHLKQVLNSHGILSVTVCSYEQKPLVSLTNQHLQVLPKLGDDWKSCEDFTKECYFKAQAVIVALSPGYLEYAEEFRHGAKSSASKQQEIIRWLHEKIKDEHIAQHRKPKSEMNSRFLPLLLKKMNAVEKHMPDIFKTMKWKKFANKNDKWLESLKKKLANKFLKERET